MILSEDLARKIVEKSKEATDFNINVMNKEGIIISSSDPKRIDTFHEGAFQVIQTGEEMIISQENWTQWSGTKPGINMPITFHNQIVGVIGITGEPNEVIPYAKAIRLMTEMILQEAFLLEQISIEERTKEYLVHEIISNHFEETPDEMIAKAELLKIDLTLKRAILLIHIQGDLEEIHKFEANLPRFKELNSLFPIPEQVLITQIKPDLWVVIIALSKHYAENRAKSELYKVASQIMKTIRSWSKINVRITIGNAYPALNKLKKSYDEAKNALKILNTFPNMEDVAHISDLVLEQVLLDVKEETRELLIRESLYNLLSDSELLQTLQSFFHCSCNVTDTAKMMNLHRNTLLYRLQKIGELTGLNPKVFKDAMQLQIALLFIKQNVQNFG